MLETVFGTVVEVTLASSVVIILLLTLSKVLDKHFTATWRYWLWLILAIRLVLPFNITLASPPVQLPTTEIVNLLTAIVPAQQLILQQTTTAESLVELDDHFKGITAATADPLSTSNFQLEDILWILWIAGTLAFICWQLINYALFLRLIKSRCTAVSQPEMISEYKDICREMMIKHQIPLMTSPLISSPLVLGIWKQQLFLPEMGLTPQHLRMILRHELIHIQRRDILYKTLILLVRALHWFNPLVHLMAKAANKDVEASCDAAVVANQDIDFRKEYSKAILLIIHSGRSSQVVFSSHFGGGKMMIMTRLENLFDMRKKRKGILPFIVIILLIGMIGLCVSCRPSTTSTSKAAATTTNAATTVAANDPKLLGKWVEEMPADIIGLPLDSIEFFTDGKASIAEQYSGTYKINDEKLQCTFNAETYTGKYEVNGTKLTIFKDSGESKVYIKTEVVVSNDPKLLGKWVEEANVIIVGLPLNSIEFFADDKTNIADIYNGTYRIVDGKLQVAVNEEVYTGKYEINGTKLTIYKDSGESKVYIRK